MTNDDELLEWLDDSHKICMGLSNGPHELFGQTATRIRELKAELAFYKGFYDGVCKTGTHVVVPVEPTEAMRKEGQWHCQGSFSVADAAQVYRSMIKAAQEGDNG